jgi:hypothetical protein
MMVMVLPPLFFVFRHALRACCLLPGHIEIVGQRPIVILRRSIAETRQRARALGSGKGLRRGNSAKVDPDFGDRPNP